AARTGRDEPRDRHDPELLGRAGSPPTGGERPPPQVASVSQTGPDPAGGGAGCAAGADPDAGDGPPAAAWPDGGRVDADTDGAGAPRVPGPAAGAATSKSPVNSDSSPSSRCLVTIARGLIPRRSLRYCSGSRKSSNSAPQSSVSCCCAAPANSLSLRIAPASPRAASGSRSGPRTTSATTPRTRISDHPTFVNIVAQDTSAQRRPDGQLHPGAVPDQLDGHVAVGTGAADRHHELVGGVHLPVADPGDDVALTQPALLGGGPVADVDDLCALHVPVVGLAGVDADGGVPDLALGHQFGRDVPDVIDRDREAESDGPARLGEDRRVDPDHRAARVDERTAGVAG